MPRRAQREPRVAHSGVVYARPNLDGRFTTFGVSGALWRDSLVMYDRTTGTLWTQLTGTAILGPRRGHVLTQIPSQVTTWAQWRERHPETLARTSSVDSHFRRTAGMEGQCTAQQRRGREAPPGPGGFEEGCLTE